MTRRPAICFLENDGRFAPATDASPIRTHPGDWNGDGTTSVQDIFDFLCTPRTPGHVWGFLTDYFSPPSLVVCECVMADYPYILHPQGAASDECYDHYKHKSASAWLQFKLCAEECKIPGSICLNCTCMLRCYLEWSTLDLEAYYECVH